MKALRVLLPILIVVVALILTVILIKARKAPVPEEAPFLGPLVEVAELVKINHQVVVGGTGTVQSRFETSITPQVRGQVSQLSPQVVAGGVFRKGELLFAIEEADYLLAVVLARASLAQAELELLRNENMAAVARKEWRALNAMDTAEPNPLVVYEPQLKSAKAQLGAAQANVELAELNLQRTRVVAPFNGYVRSETLEIGQFLNAGAPVATVAGTDQVEIVVPLPLDDLAWLQVPRNGSVKAGSKAKVQLQSGAQTFHWQGVITRALGEIDPRSRMARVVVTVAETSSTVGKEGNILNELLPGMFVEVSLQGEELLDVVAVPRGALRDNDTVWVVDNENKLQMRPVDILRRERAEVLIGAGLSAGEKIILTSISGAAEGMLLRPQLQESR